MLPYHVTDEFLWGSHPWLFQEGLECKTFVGSMPTVVKCLSTSLHTVYLHKSSSWLVCWMNLHLVGTGIFWICLHQYSLVDSWNFTFPRHPLFTSCVYCQVLKVYWRISGMMNMGVSWYCYDCVLSLVHWNGERKKKFVFGLNVILWYCRILLYLT
jgi:hypothetical protein